MKKFLQILSLVILVNSSVHAQPDRWQQRVKYTMNIDMNVQTNQFTGKQKLEYWNNSSDTLTRVFYHLYFNAFQPGSMMDVRSRRQGTIMFGRTPDWDPRVKDRILNLKPDEIGYQKINSLKMDGRVQSFTVEETILEVKLDKPILPKSKVVFDMDFEAQVPLQIRRSGRDNPMTKVRYSMSQWYPKLCEYDYEGWHPTPYVGREFYGVWGDYDVTINIDKAYTVAGTGYVLNGNQVGHGFETVPGKTTPVTGEKLSWHIVAPNVHDFVWAADPEFIHLQRKVRDSLTLHVFFKLSNFSRGEWEEVLNKAEKALPYIEQHFGPYPYKQYSFVHGGDGGMEYPMATLMYGPGAWLHEWMHSWYQGMLGTNESLYAWMDEGFTSYAEEAVTAFMEGRTGYVQANNYAGYYGTVRSGKEEALITHDDHYNTNFAHANVYSKGAVFLEQLGYITGASNRDKILLEYYRLWRFKHPNANDFIRVAEKVSDMKLDWYKEYWINSTRTIDYSIDSLWEEGGKTNVRLSRIGLMPMPIDLQLTFKDGSREMHYIPMNLMYGAKPAEDPAIPRIVYEPWKWTHSTYIISSTHKLADFKLVEIDPSGRLADVDQKNNKLDLKW